ncbi:MAG: heme biosynthesis protein HemY [Paracoccus denitrificans]|uniref:Heme biosynthesis protein HemY n=1 Tax=Paracoccus denitrificans TaxID=266 RepID=A0A533I6F2_PARDE|nr:MAG: heme biosynthesis protein HemY [Paracoccus denitrificans]
MLLSLLKILLFFAVILAIALGLNTLSANTDGVHLVVAGQEYFLGPIQAVIALVVLVIAGWAVMKLLGMLWAFIRFIMGDETAINRYFARSRRQKGIEALSQGLLAVASGEGKQAQDMAVRAAKYLDDPRATRLLAAQAAEVAGDNAKAESVYREMLEDDRTRFVGVRGLMKQKLADGDTHTALALAQKAYALKPRHTEVQNTLLELSAKEGDWKGARSVLKDKRKQGELPRDVHIRRDAVLALQEARDVLSHGNSISAREAAISAAKASPDLIPAVAMAARTYIEQKDRRNAERLLEKAWSVRPHPDLAEVYAEIVPDETPHQRLRRFESLMKRNPDDEETRLLRAELLLADEDFPAARRALGDLAVTHPTTRTLAIMAAVERGEGGSDAAVRAWLVKAMTASRGPQWVCDKCDHVMEDWGPICDNCGGFDTLTWREPAVKRSAASPAGAELLPLLVGKSNVGKNEGHARQDVPDAEEVTRHETTVVADVAPGMVPRESDFQGEPSRTITDPEPVTTRPEPTTSTVPQRPAAEKLAPASEAAAVAETAAPKVTVVQQAGTAATRSDEPSEARIVRPDVELPEDDSLPPARDDSRHARLVLDGDTPPRPDVEPPEPTVKRP